MDLTGFLTACLDEDEADAREVHRVQFCSVVGCPDYEFSPDDCDCGVPARVLREVEAKRKILAEHARLDDGWQGLAEHGGESLHHRDHDRPDLRSPQPSMM